MSTRLRLFVVGVAAAIIVFLTVVSLADTVRLVNGLSIDAESTAVRAEGAPKGAAIPEGKTRLLFSNGGWMDISTEDIASIETNEEDAFE